MAYDRYDPERQGRERGFGDDRRPMRGRDDHHMDRGRGEHDMDHDRGDRGDRGFFERMGDEVRGWFGDDDRGDDRDRGDHDFDRGHRSPRGDLNRRSDEDRNFRSGYRPMAGDYSRSGEDFARDSKWDRDPYRRTDFAGSRARSNHDDLHYEEWRRRQMDDLDRDYDDYRRERQSRFEEDFGSWRDRRTSKREMLREVREHMDVVGSDGEHVGKVDRVAGDRVILARSDPDAGGAHHSLPCTNVERVEDGRVILDVKADEAQRRWRDESRERALFEREDQGRAGPGILDRSFSGTYR